jgi:O-methyltransferase domain/Dimerisation domain
MWEEANNLISGRWRSQTLYAGVELGVFDQLTQDRFQDAETVATALNANTPLLYRLMRALASIGLLVENPSHAFATSDLGNVFSSRHPRTLRYRVLTAEGPEHYAIWRHLPAIIRDGRESGFVREYGASAFEYARTHEGYRQTFDKAMTGHSTLQSELVVDALSERDFSDIATVCDIGGGHGHLLHALLERRRHLTGILFDLPEVFETPDGLRTGRLESEGRCSRAAGNMFAEVPRADAYMLKMILHNWSDQECLQILQRARESAAPGGRIFVIEHIVPGPANPHFAKLFDIHMLCWGPGRERTHEEYVRLLEAAGWTYDVTWYPENRLIGVIEGESQKQSSSAIAREEQVYP